MLKVVGGWYVEGCVEGWCVGVLKVVLCRRLVCWCVEGCVVLKVGVFTC